MQLDFSTTFLRRLTNSRSDYDGGEVSTGHSYESDFVTEWTVPIQTMTTSAVEETIKINHNHVFVADWYSSETLNENKE